MDISKLNILILWDKYYNLFDGNIFQRMFFWIFSSIMSVVALRLKLIGDKLSFANLIDGEYLLICLLTFIFCTFLWILSIVLYSIFIPNDIKSAPRPELYIDLKKKLQTGTPPDNWNEFFIDQWDTENNKYYKTRIVLLLICAIGTLCLLISLFFFFLSVSKILGHLMTLILSNL